MLDWAWELSAHCLLSFCLSPGKLNSSSLIVLALCLTHNAPSEN